MSIVLFSNVKEIYELAIHSTFRRPFDMTVDLYFKINDLITESSDSERNTISALKNGTRTHLQNWREHS